MLNDIIVNPIFAVEGAVFLKSNRKNKKGMTLEARELIFKRLHNI